MRPALQERSTLTCRWTARRATTASARAAAPPSCVAGPATTSCWAARETTSSSAVMATTCSAAAAATTCSIGGAGGDSLDGGHGDDILIAGTTDHDANDSALLDIMMEWTSNHSLQQRVNNLKNGTGGGSGGPRNGTTFLNDLTVARRCLCRSVDRRRRQRLVPLQFQRHRGQGRRHGCWRLGDGHTARSLSRDGLTGSAELRQVLRKAALMRLCVTEG